MMIMSKRGIFGGGQTQLGQFLSIKHHISGANIDKILKNRVFEKLVYDFQNFSRNFFMKRNFVRVSIANMMKNLQNLSI